MNNSQELKDKLGKTTEQLESKIREFFSICSPHYTSLEPWQRGLILIALALFLLFSIYYLTKSSKSEKASSKQETLAEEKLMKQMAFFKRLRE